MASVAWADTPAAFAVPVVLFGVANGINIPSLLTVLTSAAPTTHRAAFMSVNGMLLRLGQTLGPVLVGAAYRTLSLDGAFYVSAGLAVGMLALLSAMKENAVTR